MLGGGEVDDVGLVGGVCESVEPLEQGGAAVLDLLVERLKDAAVLGPGVGLVDLGAVALGLGELEGGVVTQIG